MKRISAVAAAAALTLSLVACSPQNEAPSTDAADSSATTEATQSAESSAVAIEFKDAVIREKGTDKGMTGIFGELVNTSDEDVIITGFTTSLGDARYEIHETVDGTMKKMDDPLVIPAGETHVLKPGGDHLMIMEYMEAIPAGDVVDITLELEGGETAEITDVPVRAMGAGDEDYDEGGELSGHSMEDQSTEGADASAEMHH